MKIINYLTSVKEGSIVIRYSLRTFTFLLLLFSFQFSQAQFTESFEAGIPGTWTVINGGDANTWFAGPPADGNGANTGTESANIHFSATAHDDHLITPQFTVTAGTSDRLTLFSRNRSVTFVETFDILLSTTGNAAADFTTTIASAVAPPTSWVQGIYDLTPYVGQTVYISFYSSTTNEWQLYLDDITVEAIPACPDPTALTATNITTTGADLAWTENGPATVWDLEIGVSGFTPTGTPTDAGVTANPYTWTGGMADTTYDFYVRADCGTTNGVSMWVGPFSFTTACGVTTPGPTSCQDFTSFPNCWSEATLGTLAGGPANNPASNAWGVASGVVRTNLFSTGDLEWLISEEYDLSAAGGPFDLTFTTSVGAFSGGGPINMGSDDVVTLVITTDGGTSWSTLQTWDATSAPSNAGDAITISLAAYAGMTAQFAWVSTEGTVNDPEDYYFNLDDVCVDVPVACSAPSGLTATNETASGADLAWTENGTATLWDLEIGAAGFTPTGTPTDAGVTANPYTWAGGMSETTYDFYVRADCGGATSAWGGPVSFTTLCTPVTPGPTSCEDFSATLSSCWSEATLGTLAGGPANNPASNAWTVSSGVVRTNMFSTGDLEWLITPEYDLSAAGGPFDLTFTTSVGAFSGGGPINMGSDDVVTLVITTDGGTSWTTLQTWDATSAPSNAGDAITISLAAYAGMTAQFAWVSTEGTVNDPEDYYFNLDDVCVDVPATCAAPSGLTATNITATGADLAWTENGTAALWDLEIGVSGFTPSGTPTDAGVTANPYTWSSGMPETTYDFYVRADCGGGITSTWIGPVSFTTACAALVPDACEDFTSYVPNCWTEGNGGSPTGGPADFNGSSWTADGFGNNGTTGSARIETFSTFLDHEWLITPSYDLTGGPFEANFDVALTIWNLTTAGTMGSDDFVHLTISTDGGTSYTILQTWDATTTISPTGDNTTIDLTPYNNMTVQFGFVADDGIINDIEDTNWYVDNFCVRTPPACTVPSSLTTSNITGSSFDISWTSTESLWDLELVAGGGTPTGTPTVEDVAATTYSFTTGLTAGNTYDVYVRSDCNASSNGESVWTGPVSVYIPLPNEACGTATSVPVEVDCSMANPTPLDWANATVDLGPVASCDGTTGNYGFWYSFVAPASGNVNVYDDGVTGFEAAVFDACGGNEVYCSSSSTAGQVRNVTGLTSGNTYYVVVWRDGTSTITTTMCVEAGPVCVDPSGLTASNETTTGADLAWTENGPATMWDLEIGVAGFTPTGTPTDAGVTANPYTWTGGMAMTTYDFYVRANCGVDGTSAWIGPASFTTLCAVLVPDVCEDFTSYIPNCWTEGNGGDLTTGPADNFGSSWTSAGSFANDGSGNAAVKINIYSDFFAPEWIISGEYDLTGGPFEAKFDVALTGFNNSNAATMGADDIVEFAISTNGGTTWTVLETFNASNEPSTAGDMKVYDLTSYAGMTAQFAWIAEDNVDDPEDYDFHVDNFCVESAPCDDPTNPMATNITSTGADLSWTAAGTATMWDIEVVTTGTTPTGTPTVTGVTNPYTWTGGMASTSYDYYVRSDCGGGNVGNWVGPTTFVTTMGGNPCPPSLMLTGTNIGDNSGPNNMNDNESSGTITSTQVISSTAIIDYDSATDIILMGGFETQLGAIFEAFIDGCNNGGGGSNAQQGSNGNSSK